MNLDDFRKWRALGPGWTPLCLNTKVISPCVRCREWQAVGDEAKAVLIEDPAEIRRQMADTVDGSVCGIAPVERFGNGSVELTASPEPKRDVRPGDWLGSLTSAERKECAVHHGLFGYFPDALAAVARHSYRSNEKHNPGQPLHWSRAKSSDHNDCVGRHTLATAADPDARDDGQPEVICRAWRALAALQLWIEDKHARGEKV